MFSSKDRTQEKPTDTFTLLPSNAPMPAKGQITSVSVVPFTKDGKILAAMLDRGIDIPGGHAEPTDKSIQHTARRETKEEVCATLKDDLKVAAIIQSSRLRNGKPTYMVILAGSVDEKLPQAFRPDEKSTGRVELTPGEFLKASTHFALMPEIIDRACHVQGIARPAAMRPGTATAPVAGTAPQA